MCLEKVSCRPVSEGLSRQLDSHHLSLPYTYVGGGRGREKGTGRGDVIASERSGLELWSRSLQFSFA